ncbi:MAG: hypothetical protein GTN89_05285, partial [Acidobacteria bacterium]|nr:hypothetical protein [Acidobacteriota bacterium]NIM60608.1 hypothetical protein [Acidobacteriota bacterium]NIQ29782.1 hypothetical protein [Acidobacteriota bacterium]NIQ86722.1 hypothetical protein [Acidobacteriota bacterium]NIT10460.1 hypothetical protein [Acidobacteriota bacterium]
ALALSVAPACGQVESKEQSSSVVASQATVDAAKIGRGDRWKTDFSKISVPPDEIVSGGPPKDGIPAIDLPK